MGRGRRRQGGERERERERERRGWKREVGGGGQTFKIRKIRKNGQWKEATLTCQGVGGGGLSKGRVGGRLYDAWVR